MPCAERNWLLTLYNAAALEASDIALTVSQATRADLPLDALRPLREGLQTALSEAKAARLAYQEHIAAHGCHFKTDHIAFRLPSALG